ncbi:MAG: SH3 domain-containing protein [Betaproteobacteria bacterium]|nr:SH3 domain-containing protein [Betaproteobacteria bacterium]
MTRIWMFLLALFSLPALATPGTMIKDDTLRAQPAAAAAGVGQAAKGAAVEILGRQSGWTQIKAGGVTGWVRVLSVRGEAPAGGLADVGAALQKRDSSKVVAVAGLRGLSEEELKGARFNGQELARMDHYRVDRGGAQQFAMMANLRTRDVPHLPKPESKRSQPGGGASSNSMLDGF